MKVINQIKENKLTIENDSLLAVITNFSTKNKAYLNAINKLNKIIIAEFNDDNHQFEDIDVIIARKEIINEYMTN